MMFKDKILSIPPYISTPWKNIVSLQVETRPFGHVLIVELITGSKVEIPNLDRPTIEQVFAAHASVVEQEGAVATQMPFPLTLPLPNLEGMSTVMHHSEEQKNAEPLPAEMLEKIAAMTKGLIPEDLSSLQPPVDNCNCPHCQITRAILDQPVETKLQIEEEVTEDDLKFRTWDIKQENEKLYSVTNPLDNKEHYNVFLGEPLGCTCGSKTCEHIQAVLKS